MSDNHKNLTKNEQKVLAFFKEASEDAKGCTVTGNVIALKCGLPDRSTACKVANQLRRKGLVRIIPNGKKDQVQLPNTYRVVG